MDDAERVRVRERACDLAGDAQQARERKGRVPVEREAQLFPVEVLHRQVAGAVLGRAVVDDVDDVRVVELLRGGVLAREALHGDLVLRDVGVQHLHGHAPLGLLVARLVDAAHGAVGDVRDEDVLAELVAEARIEVLRILLLDRDGAVVPTEKHAIGEAGPALRACTSHGAQII